MMKNMKIIFSFLIISQLYTTLAAQTFVDTTVQNKKAVLEVYTGAKGTFDAQGHKMADDIRALDTTKMTIINVHTTSFAAPGLQGGILYPDYRTGYGANFFSAAGGTGVPTGSMNRMLFPALGITSNTAMSRGLWDTTRTTVLNEISPVNVAVLTAYDSLTRLLTATVEIYFTDTVADSLFINVGVKENNIAGPQYGDTSYYPAMYNGSLADYTHNNMLRYFFTGQWGEYISSKPYSKGNYWTNTYTWTVPDSLNSVALYPENFDVFAFVSEYISPIITGTSTPVVGTLSPLAGVYTVGGGSPAFDSLRHAVAALVSRGVSDTVIFKVRPGIYDGQLKISPFSGMDSSHPVYFVKDTAFTGTIDLLASDASSGSANYYIWLDSAKYVSFSGFNFKKQTANTKFVKITGVCTRISFDNCVFNGKSDVAIETGQTLADLVTYLTISNSVITKEAGTGISMGRGNNNSFIGNRIEGFGYNGGSAITFQNSTNDNVRIIGNTLKSNQNYFWSTGNVYGLDFGYGGVNGEVSFNRIFINAAGKRVAEGINCRFKGVSIHNNAISVYGRVQQQATAFRSSPFGDGGDGNLVYFNTFVVNTTLINGNPDTTSVAFHACCHGQNNILNNNQFINLGAGAAIGVSVTGFSSDYNNIYSARQSLTSWRNTHSGKDLNSLEINPRFLTDTTLVPRVPELDSAGTFVSGIITDIRDSSRYTIAPSIGAYEYVYVCDGLSGTYTIGGASPDYTSVSEAVDDLNHLGVCDSVLFNVRQGSYTGFIYMAPVYNASALNRITFRADPSNTAAVILTDTLPTSPTHINYNDRKAIFTFSSEGYLKFKDIHFEVSTSTSSSARTSGSPMILLYGYNEYLEFLNCDFIGLSGIEALIMESHNHPVGSRTAHSKFLNCSFRTANSAVILDASDGLLDTTTSYFDNCNFEVLKFSIAALADTLHVLNSYIESYNGANTNKYGIQAEGTVFIKNNRIRVGAHSEAIGAYIFGSNHAEIVNNEIIIRNYYTNPVYPSRNIGILINSAGGGVSIHHNSIKNTAILDSSAITNAPLMLNNLNSDAEVHILNNVLYTSRNSAYRLSNIDTAAVLSIDYNNIFSGQDSLATIDGMSFISPLQLHSVGFDSNTVFADPFFISDTVLKPYSLHLDSMGTSMAGITTDLLSLPRSTPPDIGAYEFEPIVFDVRIDSLRLDTLCEGNKSLKVKLYNMGDSVLSTARINWRISRLGILEAQFSEQILASNLLPHDSVWVQLNPFAFNGGTNYEISLSVDTLNGYRDYLPGDNGLWDTLFIHPVPFVSASYISACEGDSIFLTASGGQGQYRWTGPASFIDTIVSPSIGNASSLNSGTYVVRLTDSNYCTGVDSFLLLLDTMPVVHLPADTSLCAGQSILLKAPSHSTFEYLWSTGDSVNQIPVDTTGIYILEVTDAHLCSGRDTFVLSIDTLPLVGFSSSLPFQCQFDDPYIPTEGFPSGGIYSGSVIDTLGRISAMQFGTFPIQYTYTDSNGCTASADTAILIRKRPTVSLLNFGNYCTNILLDTINTHSPKGGVFYGLAGILNDTLGIVAPALLPAGTDTLYYAYYDGFCRDTVYRTFDVYDTTVLSFSTPVSICANDTAIMLSEADSVPGGQFGIYSGPGITGAAIFNPLLTTTGTKTLSYSFTNTLGCTSHATRVIAVDTLPALSLLQPNVCVNTPSFNLMGGTPSGGNYFGRGVSMDTLFPAIAGTGLDTVFYRFTDGHGCTDTVSKVFTVKNIPAVSLNLPDSIEELCAFGDAVFLAGQSPLGGAFDGNHVGASKMRFHPDTAGVFTIKYSYTAANACTDSVVDFIIVHELPATQLSYKDSLNGNGICVNAVPHTLFGGSPIGGHYTGFGVDAGGEFNPQVAGVQNNYQLEYAYTDTNGCTARDTNFFRIDSLTPITLGLIPDFCVNGGLDTLRQGSIFIGGRYLGTGVTNDSIYNPLLVGVGFDTIVYIHSNLLGCSDTLQQTIEVYAAPVVSFNLPVAHSEVCVNEPSIALNFATPSGGSYTAATGISAGNFSPSLAGIGRQLITYTYSDSNNCTDWDTASILVRTIPVVGFTPDTFCVNTPNTHLRAGTPWGGRYLGPGMLSDSLFSPFLAGSGNKTLNYTYTDVFGCANTTSGQVRVNSKPIVSFNPLAPVCADRDTFSLTGAATTGSASWFLGSGIVDTSGGLFLAATANVGNNIIAFVGRNAQGCSDTAYRTLRVDSVPVVTLDSLPQLCATAQPITLVQGNPDNAGVGVYSGVGVVGTTFYPSLSGVGNFLLNYRFTDLNNCSDTAQRVLRVNPNPQVSLTAVPNLCLGSDSILLTQGAPAGGTYQGMFTDTATSKFKPDSVGLWGLMYSYTDSNGCSSSAISTISVRNLPSVSLNFNQRFCENGASVLLGGGLPLGNSRYSGNGVSGNRYDPTIVAAKNDTLRYIYTDNFGCTDSAEVPIQIDSITPLSIAALPSLCANGAPLPLEPFAQPSGGVFSGLGISANVFFPSITGKGTFLVQYTFTNNVGCQSLATDTVKVNDIPVITTTPDTTICPGFGAVLKAEGALSYVWSNGVIGAQSAVLPLETGNYSVTATNANNCVASRRIKVTVAENYEVFATSSPSNCGKATGSGFVSVAGGKAPFSFKWFDGVLASTHRDLSAGAYTVTVSDANGCIKYGNVAISDREAAVIVLDSIGHLNCFGDRNGYIRVSATGVAPFVYQWNTGKMQEEIIGLDQGNYAVEVKDAQGCIATRAFKLTSPDRLSASATIQSPECDSANGSIEVSVLGGTPGYNLQWSSGASGNIATGSAGYYELYISDARMCTDTLAFVMNNPNAGEVRIDSVLHVHCGFADGAIFTTPVDSIAHYQWQHGDTLAQINNLTAGLYVLTTTDVKGCKRVYPVPVRLSPPAGLSLCAVSVDTAYGFPLLLWDTASTSGIQAVLYRETGSYATFAEQVHPVPGAGQYLDTTVSADKGIYRYFIAAEDACGQMSEIVDVLQNNLLTANLVDSQVIELRWSGFNNRPIDNYLVYRQSTSLGLEILDSLSQPNMYIDYDAPVKDPLLRYFVVARFADACGTADIALSNYSRNFGRSVIGIDALQVPVSLRVYPNPSSGQIRIEAVGGEAVDGFVLYDVYGRILGLPPFQKAMQGGYVLDLSQFSSGVYYLSPQGKALFELQRIVISR